MSVDYLKSSWYVVSVSIGHKTCLQLLYHRIGAVLGGSRVISEFEADKF